MSELSLSDIADTEDYPPSHPSVVYDLPNRREGHLRIDSGGHCYVFINDGGGVIRFGHFSGPAVELTPEQLRVVGDYCHRMAGRLEGIDCEESE